LFPQCQQGKQKLLFFVTGGPLLWFGCGRQQKRHAAAPPPAGVQTRNRQKLVGGDKGSLTEQQTKGAVTTMIQIRRIHNTKQTAEKAVLTAHHCMVPSHE